MPHGTLKKYFVCFMYQSIWCFKLKKRKSEFHQLKEFSTQRWTDTKFYYSQNCPHNKKFDRSLAKNNFSYNSMVWKILFQTNLMVTVTV